MSKSLSKAFYALGKDIAEIKGLLSTPQAGPAQAEELEMLQHQVEMLNDSLNSSYQAQNELRQEFNAVKAEKDELNLKAISDEHLHKMADVVMHCTHPDSMRTTLHIGENLPRNFIGKDCLLLVRKFYKRWEARKGDYLEINQRFVDVDGITADFKLDEQQSDHTQPITVFVFLKTGVERNVVGK